MASSGMPEIGSKISLISKADIRYEGKLFTVDPNECTIALSHVRSFGTEDRQTQYPVPAQGQVYEYILFRGSDIKDITIVNTQQLPNDPAIVSGMAPGAQGGYPNHSYNHPVMSAPMGAPPQYNSFAAPGMGRNIGKQMSSELLNDNIHVAVPIPQPQQQPQPVHQPIPIHQPLHPPVQIPINIPVVKEPNSELLAGSRSSTPSLARKSPTIDQGIQVSPNKDGKKPIQPPMPRDNRQNRTDRNNYQDGYQRRDYRTRDSDYNRDRNQRDGEYRNQRDGGEYRNQRDGEYRNQRDGEYRGQRDGDFRGPREHDYRGQRDMDYRGPRDNDYRGPRDQEHRSQDSRRENYMQGRGQNQGMGRGGGWIVRGGRGGPHPGPGMRGHRGRGMPGNFNRAIGSGPNQQQNAVNAAKKNTLKFEEEYDFDKANSEFEELRSKTAKLKISGEGEAEKPKVNGEDKKDDSGNETGLGEGEPEEEAEPDSVIYYDKAKSFFDNISCEAVERSKGRSQRTDWRTERKLNSETFGVASARRGAYRGRGGYYGGRGLYRGYRGYNMRGQNNRGAPRPVHVPQPAVVAAAAK